MANTIDSKAENKYPKTLSFSILLFALVIVLTIWLYFYNLSLEKKVENIRTDISTLEQDIKKINEDDKVILYTLLKNSSIFLEQYKKLSNVTEFISNIKWLSKNYNLAFEWFSYSNSSINTTCVAKNDEISLASEKLKKFIWDFRNKENSNIFSLWFVTNFVWQTEVKFTPEFKVR